jgi:hypothetical protein
LGAGSRDLKIESTTNLCGEVKFDVRKLGSSESVWELEAET